MKINKLLKQAVGFVGISGLGWLLDFTVYTLLGLIWDQYFLSNFISSCMGVTFVFIFSTRTIFKNNSKIPLMLKYVIYLVYQLLLILAMSKVLSLIQLHVLSAIAIPLVQRFSHILAKILITPITMVLNFIVMKCLMEKI